MATDEREWRPGSFTKNYSWGKPEVGLRRLYEAIRVGFDGELREVSRQEFRERTSSLRRPDYIPVNFFLFNRPTRNVDYLVVDELVFQALTEEHSPAFDKLALLAFNLSLVGKWRGSEPYQRWPTLWSHYYVKDRVARELSWNTSKVDANDIERFVSTDRRYQAEGARKLATNLSYLFQIGRLPEFANSRVERWWVDGLFLALDRAIEDRKLDGEEPAEGGYSQLLQDVNFQDLAGKRSLPKDLAESHLQTLYGACGGRERFSNEQVREITALRLPDVEWLLANDDRPQGAVHPTNPQILKSIPRACAWLAKYAGFDVLDADELATFDAAEFVRRRTRSALRNLKERGIRPSMSAEALDELTRGR
jgi:hypothetical protein